MGGSTTSETGGSVYSEIHSQWRNLPNQFPHWQAVYYYFDQWKTDGTLERINRALNQLDRTQEEREALPSVFCVDSQSVKLAPMICEYRGLDSHKKVNGRKRQLLVDTGGRLWAAHVHAANDGDGPAALALISDILWYGDRVEKVFGDGSYGGVFAKALAGWGLAFERAARPESAQGFVPVAKRWVVERTIAWTNRSGDPVFSAHRQRLRVYAIFFGRLATFSQHSADVATDQAQSPNLIPQHLLSNDFGQPKERQSYFLHQFLLELEECRNDPLTDQN
ncbi:transposase IS4 family protein [Spirosoma linguale DSM 74]|uniref:Transposase IS4 family protein n=1 Tax=Spirosoma linguale (strain ATCC 33905 / DSM 74 / LMG 10896 / Claus 1) TaxID=504472 RepID=D2QQP7_SPILD|nr:transposase IS4 family protein [Spirosoma linguale DSM 74]